MQWNTAPASWCARPLADRLEILRQNFYTGPCGASQSAQDMRGVLDTTLREAAAIARTAGPAPVLDEDERIAARVREQHRDRVRCEGFEALPITVEAGNRACQSRVYRKSKGRWVHEPCGAPTADGLHFAGPDHPDGLDVSLCRGHLATLATALVTLLGCPETPIPSDPAPEPTDGLDHDPGTRDAPVDEQPD